MSYPGWHFWRVPRACLINRVYEMRHSFNFTVASYRPPSSDLLGRIYNLVARNGLMLGELGE